MPKRTQKKPQADCVHLTFAKTNRKSATSIMFQEGALVSDERSQVPAENKENKTHNGLKGACSGLKPEIEIATDGDLDATPNLLTTAANARFYTCRDNAVVLPFKDTELITTLFENIDTSGSQFHMEISMEGHSNIDDPEEFDYRTEENYESDCADDEESMEEEQDEDEYGDVPTEEDSTSTGASPSNQIFELLRRSTKENIISILKHIYKGSDAFMDQYYRFVTILKQLN